MFEYIPIFLLLVCLLFVLGVSVYFRQAIHVLGKPMVMFVLASAWVLLIAQGMQLFAYIILNAELQQAAQHLSTLVWLVVLARVSMNVWSLSLREQGYKQTQQWLIPLYDAMASAVFVLKDDRIIYSNAAFKVLQKKFRSGNPFSQITPDQTKISLIAHSGERCVYSLQPVLLSALNGHGFIITDITPVQFQTDFIQSVAKNFNAKSTQTMNSILALIHELIPKAIVYVGEYNTDINGYRYVAHKGEEKRYIFSDMKLDKTQFKKDNWAWFNTHDNAHVPDLVLQSGRRDYGGIILRESANVTLGVILVVGLAKQDVNDLLLDFLSIFSIRVRSELAHRQDKRQIEQSRHRYRAFIESSHEAIADLTIQPSIYIDDSVSDQWRHIQENAQLKEVNGAFKTLFGFTTEPPTQDFFKIKCIENLMQYVLDSGYNSNIIEIPYENENAEVRWLSCTVMADIEAKRLHRLWVILRDITDSKNHIQHLKHQNRHDNITGLPNRSALREHLEDKIEQASQFGLRTALLLIDLDQFKEVNDALGHHYGDVLLKKIEPRLREIVSHKRAYLARLGGDEFAIVVSSVESEDEMHDMAIDVVQKLREPFDLGQLNVEIGCSIGIAFYPENGEQASHIMRCADVAMYKAKKDTSRILHYDSGMDDSSPRRLALMTDLKKGLRNHEFFLVYQPKLDLKNNKIDAAEALLRWEHETLGLIGPTEFIPLAEMSDVIVGMTHWVIDSALAQMKKWMDQGVYIKTSVNVSMRNLLNDDLPGFMQAKLNEHQVPADLLEIEITESALMCEPERALNALKLISKMGVHISVDDFGIGYSSFIYLRQLPVDTLKIDIMFVRHMCANSQDEIIVDSIINLGHNLSLDVVAEGAEDLATIERLSAIGCDMAQGYFVSRPVLPDAFLHLHKTWGKDDIH